MSARLRTFRIVNQKILASNEKEILSTYQTSYANFCSHEIALRPLTCAHPVIPGMTS